MLKPGVDLTNREGEGVTTITRAQKRIIGEIDDIAEEMGLDHRALVEEWEGNPYLTEMLKLARRSLIAGAIVGDYTFCDEMLGTIIARYFFSFGDTNYRKLWRTKRFQRFNYFILERLYLQQKLALVKDIARVPKDVVAYIDRLNDLRNAVAHAFFPENLRGDRTKYKGLDVFTLEGFSRLRADRETAVEFLSKRAFGI